VGPELAEQRLPRRAPVSRAHLLVVLVEPKERGGTHGGDHGGPVVLRRGGGG